MLAVPVSLSQAFDAQLVQRNVPDRQRRDFQKWFRFYLDFCDKYDSKPELTASFAKFDEKLQSKGQSESQRQQARRAIAIYYRMVGAIQSPSIPTNDSPPTKPWVSRQFAKPIPAPLIQTDLTRPLPENPKPSPADGSPKLTGANWVAVYEQPLSRCVIIRTKLGRLTATGCSNFKPTPKVKMFVCWIWTM